MSLRQIVFCFCLGLANMAWGATAEDSFQAANDLYQQQQWAPAAQKYQETVQMDSQNWRAYQALGNCYYQMGKTGNALNAYKQSLKLHPDNPALQNYVNTLSGKTSPASPSNPSPAASTQAEETASHLNPEITGPLPRKGSIAWNVGLASWVGNFQDVQDFYGASVDSSQTPYGAELDLGADFTIARSFQVGLQGQGMFRVPETFSFDSGAIHEWDVNTLGGALVCKFLIPVQDRWNLIFHLEGGYYVLVGSTIQASGFSTGTTNLDGSNFGGLLSLEGEFLQGENNGWAIDVGLGYRFLTFNPVAISGDYNGFVQSGNLTNLAGSNAYIDLSGLRLNATLRFY